MLEIIVPATSANLGPGFDCLGIALNLYNKFYFEETENSLEILGCDEEFTNENNLVYTSMKYFYENQNCTYIPSGIKIRIDEGIPISRGLGSSASCIVAGVLAANILTKSNLTKDDLLRIATEIEGHPDNVAPALFGNMIVSVTDNNDIYYNIIPVPNELRFCALIPKFSLSTSESRSILPKYIPYADGVYNIGRASLLVSAFMNHKLDLIKVACKDKLHQNYRGTLIKDFDTIVNYINTLESYGVFLSGAGPTIMTIIKTDDYNFISSFNSYLNNLESDWILKYLSCDNLGTVVNVY